MNNLEFSKIQTPPQSMRFASKGVKYEGIMHFLVFVNDLHIINRYAHITYCNTCNYFAYMISIYIANNIEFHAGNFYFSTINDHFWIKIDTKIHDTEFEQMHASLLRYA